MTDAGQEQVPVEKLLGQERQHPAQRRAWLTKLVGWRDWKLPVKLAAVSLVPIMIALTLGVSTLSSQVERSNSYQRIESLITLSGGAGELLGLVQAERTETAARLTEGTGTSTALEQARSAVDSGIEPVLDAAGTAIELDAGLSGAVGEVTSVLGGLEDLREDVASGQLDPAQSIEEYSAITDGLLQLDAAAVARVSDAGIGSTPQALHHLRGAKEEVSVQQALIGFGIARGVLTPTELTGVRTSEVRIDDRLDDFNAVATAAQRQVFDTAVSGTHFATRDRLARASLGELGTPAELAIQQISQREWENSSSRVLEQVGAVAERLYADAADSSSTLASDSRTGVGLLAALLLLAFAVALAVVWVITRHLLRSLRVLRTSAMRVADERLPEAVRDIQEGNATDSNIEPVPVHSADEFGEVARAFDAVHNQALRLAVEQAGMRAAYSTVFVNLSRRSQSLVQRQLQLIERLERDEEDADQLATLFQLDHLATRMRRNNENLMVLSGSENGRRSGRPVNTADVLRAAVSEIEQYQRVIVQSPPTTKVVGHAASDLMRLLAELLDNATAFSPPETQVTVSSSVGHNGSMTVDILDKGIGMNAAEVAEANSRMTEASAVDLVASRRMGLFVVGRLANRHGIGVELHGGKGIAGVRATVTVPAELVLGTGGGPLTSEMPAISDAGPLPRRQTGAHGDRSASLSGFGGPIAAKSANNGDGAARTASSASSGAASEEPGVAAQDVEVSGTALFSPITGDEQQDEATIASAQLTNGRAQPLPKRQKNGVANGVQNRVKHDGTASPSGEALFETGTSALSNWWSAAANSTPAKPLSEDVPASRAETTPIFDEMLSVWFRTSADPQADRPLTSTEEQDRAWDFAADANWRTVQEIAKKSTPSTFTEAGLPRRQRGEQLLPGSATPEPVSASPSRSAMGRADLPARDPKDVRNRLSSFQRGVGKARHQRVMPNPESPAAGADAGQESNGATNDAWSFDPDRALDTASQGKSAAFTEAGLPRRRRGEQLLPGSATAMAGTTPVKAPQPERDPDALRGRLSSFQQGVRRGRQTSTPTPNDTGKKMEGE